MELKGIVMHVKKFRKAHDSLWGLWHSDEKLKDHYYSDPFTGRYSCSLNYTRCIMRRSSLLTTTQTSHSSASRTQSSWRTSFRLRLARLRTFRMMCWQSDIQSVAMIFRTHAVLSRASRTSGIPTVGRIFLVCKWMRPSCGVTGGVS